MTLEERALVGMYTRAVEARELIQTISRLSDFLKEGDGFSPASIRHLLGQADNSLFDLASALSRQVSEHTESTQVLSQGTSARSEK